MLRFTLARSAPALVLLVVVGCAGSADDGAGTSEGAETVAPAAVTDARAKAIVAGNYGGRMHGEWDGSLAIKNASPEKFDFEFEISPDLDVAPIGRLGGAAKLRDGHFRYDDGSCAIEFEHVTHAPGAERGDLFVNASISCGVMLGIDGHSTSSTALDFTATWRRL